MLILFAPVLSLAALITGSIATMLAILLNGPRRLRRPPREPLVLLPPVPCPGMEEYEAELEEALAVI